MSSKTNKVSPKDFKGFQIIQVVGYSVIDVSNVSVQPAPVLGSAFLLDGMLCFLDSRGEMNYIVDNSKVDFTIKRDS